MITHTAVLNAVSHLTGVGDFISCGEEYSDKNIFSQAGWGEAKISGFCERCFDASCGEM